MVAYQSTSGKKILKAKVDRIKIGKKYVCAADLDSGARLCFMGKRDYLNYRDSGGKTAAMNLSQPLRIQVANNRIEYNTSCLKEDISIPIEDSFVSVKNVLLYIIDGQWGEVLIGWPVLQALDATPEQTLSKSKGKIFDMDNFDQEEFGLPYAKMVDIILGKSIQNFEIMCRQASIENSWNSSAPRVSSLGNSSFESKPYFENEGMELWKLISNLKKLVSLKNPNISILILKELQF